MNVRDALGIVLLVAVIILVVVLILYFADRTPSLHQPEGATLWTPCPLFF